MRRTIIAALAATILTAGCATSRENVREEREDLREAQVSGDREAIRDAKHDLREKQREYQEDKQCGPAYGRPC